MPLVVNVVYVVAMCYVSATRIHRQLIGWIEDE